MGQKTGNHRPGAERPLSPHLQIYKPMLTMMMSILHRLTGVGLYFGALLLVWWLMAAASGPVYFSYVNGLLDSIPGKAGYALFPEMFRAIVSCAEASYVRKWCPI